jgi:hypothetical protein
MRKNTLIFVLLFILHFHALSQKSFSGRVNDDNFQGLPFATVLILDSQGKNLYSTYCDSSGYFKFQNIKFTNNLKVRAYYLNDTSDEHHLFVDSIVNDFVIIVKTFKGLNEVTVDGSRKPLIERKVDRLVYNLGDRSIFKDKTTAQILKTIPRVDVNKNTISILGVGTASVMINDRIVYLEGKDLIDYLNIFKDDLVSIEVIPSAPSKYSASGSGGLINIITKKGKVRGIFGDITYNGIQNTYWTNDGAVSVRYREKNLNVLTSIGYARGAYKEDIVSDYKLLGGQISGWLDQQNNKLSFESWKCNLVAEYSLSKSASLNLSYNFSRNNTNNRLDQRIEYVRGMIIDSLGIGVGENDAFSDVHAIGISLRSKLGKKGSQLDIFADYVDRTNIEEYTNSNIIFLEFPSRPSGTQFDLYSFGDSPRDLTSLRIDLSIPKIISKFLSRIDVARLVWSYMKLSTTVTLCFLLSKSGTKVEPI